jgi:hypothetical protein
VQIVLQNGLLNFLFRGPGGWVSKEGGRIEKAVEFSSNTYLILKFSFQQVFRNILENSIFCFTIYF